MDKILASCLRHGLPACIYYGTVPKPQSPKTAADDIIKVLNKYGKHSAHLKINGKPVVLLNYPLTVQFFTKPLQKLGNLGILFAYRRQNGNNFKE